MCGALALLAAVALLPLGAGGLLSRPAEADWALQDARSASCKQSSRVRSCDGCVSRVARGYRARVAGACAASAGERRSAKGLPGRAVRQSCMLVHFVLVKELTASASRVGPACLHVKAAGHGAARPVCLRACLHTPRTMCMQLHDSRAHLHGLAACACTHAHRAHARLTRV